jgi:hypothetical protein
MFTDELQPGDFHVAVKRRDHTETPWRWEIWPAAKTRAVEQSEDHFATMTEALKEGKQALKKLLRERFHDAA